MRSNYKIINFLLNSKRNYHFLYELTIYGRHYIERTLKTQAAHNKMLPAACKYLRFRHSLSPLNGDGKQPQVQSYIPLLQFHEARHASLLQALYHRSNYRKELLQKGLLPHPSAKSEPWHPEQYQGRFYTNKYKYRTHYPHPATVAMRSDISYRSILHIAFTFTRPSPLTYKS